MPLAETVAIVKAFLQPPMMSRPVMVKAVESVAESVRFYRAQLGFESLGAGRVKRDGVELQFLAKSAGAGLEVRVTEIEKLFREYAGVVSPDTRVRVELGGRKSFSVTDNGGALVTFVEG